MPTLLRNYLGPICGFIAAGATMVALGFGWGIDTERARVKSKQLTQVTEVRAADAHQVSLNQGVERALSTAIRSIDETAQVATLNVTFIQPIGKDDQRAKSPVQGADAVCSADPFLSNDAVRLLNAARGHGTLAEPTSRGNAAPATTASAQR